MRRRISIIGPGNWGSSLICALASARAALGEIIDRRGRSSVRCSEQTRALPLISFDRARFDADVLWLCVPDAAIAQVCRRLVKRVGQRSLRGQIVIHSSGALSSEVLQAASEAGASVASVHPLMSFPTRVPVSLAGVPFAVEADASSRRVLNALVRHIGGKPFAIGAAGKALYHAAGMLSSPLLVSHLAAAQRAAVLAGFTKNRANRLIEPIARATLDSFFRRGAAKSFSGPIARDDIETIRLHLQALEPHPMLADVYRSLAGYALEALPSPGKKKLRGLLRQK